MIEAGQFAMGDQEVPGYLAYLPPGYDDDDSPLPLLVFLHGAGESGTGSEADLRNVLKLGIPQMIADGDWPAEHPFVVLMPQYSQARAESDCAVADEISALLQHAVLTYRIDRQRIYLTGISCGAIGIWDYLAEVEENLVAAAVPIAGHPVWAIEKAGCKVARAPIWVFHGAEDEVVAVRHVEDAVDQLRSCTDPPRHELEMTVYPDADHFENDAWSRTYDLSAGHDIFSWLLEHSSGALLTVETRGGLCPEGPCGTVIVIERDGRVHQAAKPPRDLGAVSPAALAALDAAIRTTDFAELREHPFTGTCPTAYDGQEVIFEFGAPQGVERVSTCEVEVDTSAPLFVAVADAIGPFVGLELQPSP